MTPESELTLYVTVGISFGIFHFFLWLFSPKARNNLFFTIYALTFSLVVFLDFRSSLAPSQSMWAFNIYLHLLRIVIPFLFISVLLLVYSTFHQKIPRLFWIYCAGTILTGIWVSFEPNSRYIYFNIWILITYFEMGRVLVVGMKRKQPGTWIIALGFLLFGIFSFYDFITDIKVIGYIHDIHNGYPAGFLGLTACFSIFLARDFSVQNQRILDEEKKAQNLEFQKKLLEEEDRRKSKELDQARELQLSMLPESDHKPDGIDIAFRMISATEVGGDYYDFRHDDRSFVVAVGDALGHGLRAGMIVTVVKSLFISESELRDSVNFFRKCSTVFRTMKLRKLFMGLLLVRIEKKRMILASAGMPPVLIYRKMTGFVETLIHKSMPLGGPVSFPYRQTEVTLQSGDVIVMMSDGVTERFNKDREMLGQETIKKWLNDSAGQPAEAILNVLLSKIDEWAQTEQRDDITLVVCRIK